MYIALSIRTLLWEHGWFWGEEPGRFKLVKSENAILGIGLNVEVSFG